MPGEDARGPLTPRSQAGHGAYGLRPHTAPPEQGRPQVSQHVLMTRRGPGDERLDGFDHIITIHAMEVPAGRARTGAHPGPSRALYR